MVPDNWLDQCTSIILYTVFNHSSKIIRHKTEFQILHRKLFGVAKSGFGLWPVTKNIISSSSQTNCLLVLRKE